MGALETAQNFFHACESAKGWDECRRFAETDAQFHSPAGSYTGLTTLEAYCDQVAGAFATTFRGSTYALVASAYDADSGIALLQGMSYAQHTGDGGPVAPTRKMAEIPFVYSIRINSENKITRLEKLYDESASRELLGWPAL
ncbi:hypothetical protein [Tomitella fengzijianii]|uniref:SnoaL-like domain-containing protein n=1 Tax=Tomitella fengzijianii TaxID=2597660 RepID=A0A516X1N1_9ACTN|nr:hypothetical protein [Tomitella fengzijianii]QDQ96940.1 hypothetical protein FO059_05835 [Tomitella fengzijianii]